MCAYVRVKTGQKEKGHPPRKAVHVIKVLCVFRGNDVLKNQNRMSGV